MLLLWRETNLARAASDKEHVNNSSSKARGSNLLVVVFQTDTAPDHVLTRVEESSPNDLCRTGKGDSLAPNAIRSRNDS